MSGQTVCGGGKGQTGLLKTYLKTSHSLVRKEVGGNIFDSLCLYVCVCVCVCVCVKQGGEPPMM